MHGNQQFKKKKKTNKNIPVDELGFKAKIIRDVIDPRNAKLRYNKNRKKYTPQTIKQNFIEKLKIIIDMNDLPPETESQNFKINKSCDWQYVKKVIYPSRQKLYCYICLDDNFIAPQITYCGHVFCFHCILTHFKKSLNNSKSCPVCKQFTEQSQLRTCEPVRQKDLEVGDKIKMKLRVKKEKRIYDYRTVTQDINCCKILRMRTKGIIGFYERELDEVINELKVTKESQRNYIYLNQALKVIEKRIERTKQLMQKYPVNIKLQKNQRIINDTVYKYLDEKDEKKQYFYQQQSGSLVYLHNLSKKYIHNIDSKIMEFESTIIEKEQVEFTGFKNYSQLQHLSLHQDITLIMVDLKETYQEFSQLQVQRYNKQIKQYESEKQFLRKKEDEEVQRLNLRYEKEQQVIRSLKKLQEAQYYDINVPSCMDPSEMNQYTFPSLISSKSEDVPSYSEKQVKEEEKKLENKKEKHKEVNDKSEFPDLSELKTVQSETEKYVKGKGGRKRKKEKRIDITHELFRNREEDMDE